MGWTRFAFSALTLCTPALWRCTSINLSVHHRAAVQRFPFCLKDPQNESITSKSWLSVGLFLWAVSAEHSARCVSILGQSCSKDKNWKVLFLHQRVVATLEVKSVALWIWWTKGLSATCIEMVPMGISLRWNWYNWFKKHYNSSSFSSQSCLQIFQSMETPIYFKVV